jgi:Alpha/beta hydrolase of unknown function (DUF900)
MRHFAVAALFLLTACVSFPQADPNQDLCVPKLGKQVPGPVTSPADVAAKIVRFTDDGEFVDRCELSETLYELQAGGPQIVVVYVHGWKHNGDEKDPDLVQFTNQLNEIRKVELASGQPRRVVGVYVGWNGKRTTMPLVKEMTFWGRKRAADRVSQSASVTRLLGAIDSIRSKRKQPRDLVVYVGHSFGARVLYNAVAQVLIHRTQLAHPGTKGNPFDLVKGVGDLVILLNPAFEASLFTTFNALHRSDYPFRDTQPPLVVSISSKTDKATKLAFPLGQTLSFDRSPKRRTTVGNFSDYWTHSLVPRSNGEAPEGAICSSQVCMQVLSTRTEDHVPFLNVTADPQVIDGHNDIWKEELVGFIAQLIGRAEVMAQRAQQTASK